MKKLFLFILIVSCLLALILLPGESQTRRPAFSPAFISNLKIWLQANQITGLNDGDAVTTWSDSSGNGYNATQSTGSLKPLYKTNIKNGLPVVRFDGTDDFLEGTSLTMSQPEIFVVAYFAQATQANYDYLLSLGNSGASPRLSIAKWQTDNRLYNYDGTSVKFGPAVAGAA